MTDIPDMSSEINKVQHMFALNACFFIHSISKVIYSFTRPDYLPNIAYHVFVLNET